MGAVAAAGIAGALAVAGAGGAGATVVACLERVRAQGKVDELGSCLTKGSRGDLERTLASRAALAKGQAEFQRALDERFGKGEPMLQAPEPDEESLLRDLGKIELTAERPLAGGRLELQTRRTFTGRDGKPTTADEKLVAVKEGGAFRLALGFVPASRHEATQNAQRRVVEEVVAGKYPDRFAAMLALSDALHAAERK